MMRFAGVSAAVLVAVAMSGCNTMGRQPKFENAAINPVALKPGDNATITVHVVDKHKIVQRVVATVIEDQRMKFKLRDDGVPPDEKAADGIWSYPVRVPFMAPPGNFTVEVTAYNAKGEAINVKKSPKDVGPLTATVAWSITYPPDAVPPEATAETAPPPAEAAAPAAPEAPK